MRKFIILVCLFMMVMVTSVYAMELQTYSVSTTCSYKVVPKVVKVIVPVVKSYEVKTVKVWRATPWVYNYPYHTYPYYQGNYDYRIVSGCNPLVQLLRLPVYILDGLFFPCY